MSRTTLILCVILVSALALDKPWIRKRYTNGATHPQVKKQSFQPQWFNQTLDHFNTQDSRTWSQRYWVNSQMYKPGGPIFVEIGGEASLSAQDVTYWAEVGYAQTYGALFVALEHRFYGASNPLPSLATENLAYLSSEQALADLADFIVWIKGEYNAQNASVITFGGSYPGALSAFFRVKYPHITDGSIASSAPVEATLDFYKYLDVVDYALSDFTGVTCDAQIQEATNQIQYMLQNGQTSKVESLFQTCDPIQSEADIATFMSNLMGNWQGTVQYDTGAAITIQDLCAIMDNTSNSALENYVQVNKMFNGNCTPVSYTQMIQQLQSTAFSENGVGDRSWTYQSCAEFGFFQTTDSPNQPFGNLVPISYWVQMCHDLGWDFATRINATNIYYGGNNPKGSSKIYFVNGSIDPWHALSITAPQGHGIDALLINGTSHCANMFPQPTLPQLVAAQQLIEAKIGEYLQSP